MRHYPCASVSIRGYRLWSFSEADPHRETKLPFAAFHVVIAAQRAGDGHETSRRYVGGRVAEMRRVAHVVGFRAKLEGQALLHVEIAEQRAIHVHQAGAAQNVSSGGTETDLRHRGKCGGIVVRRTGANAAELGDH